MNARKDLERFKTFMEYVRKREYVERDKLFEIMGAMIEQLLYRVEQLEQERDE